MLRSAIVAVWLLGVCSLAQAQSRVFTDSTGKFRQEATLDRVEGNDVLLRKPDGKTITIPLNLLSAEDQKFVKEQAAAGIGPLVQLAPKKVLVTLSSEQKQLASQAESILRKHCYECHGNQGSNEGGFNFVLQASRLTDGKEYVHPGKPEDSLLIQRIVDEEMPPEGNETPTAADLESLKKWAAEGAPDWNQESDRPFVDIREVERIVKSDLESCTPRDRRFRRYFTLTNLFNSGASQDELETFRIAFAKLINSLSWNPRIVQPSAIDAHKTIYRIDLRDVNWSEELWTRVLDRFPYGYASDEETVEYFKENTLCEMPHVRIDWFVAQASQPPLYHDLLQIPETVKELEALLRIDAETNIDQSKVQRAGFNRSGVSQNNRMIERHETPFGAYWKSYDFAGSADKKNLFQFPMGPNSTSDSFEHDGGEMIFSLPNGFQGYMLTDHLGNRLDAGPTQIVSDPGRPDRTVVNGVSCMTCHYSGMIVKSDEIRNHVEANRVSFPEADDILAVYVGATELERLFRADERRFVTAVQSIGMVRPTKSGEPISNMSRRFETELDLNHACAELGIAPEGFATALKTRPELARAVGQLAVPGGTMKRDAFVGVFMDLVVEFRLGVKVTAGENSGIELSGSASFRSSSTNNTPNDQLVSELQLGDHFGRINALKNLAEDPPQRPDRELIEAVTKLTESTDPFISAEAFRAIVKLDPKNGLDVLLKGLDNSNSWTRKAILDLLQKLKDPRSADAVAKLIGQSGAFGADDVIRSIGAEAETSLHEPLFNPNWATRLKVARLLGEIGTQKSLAVLRKAKSDSNRLVENAVVDAIRAIENRKSSK